jgi:hypothetical protein
MKLIVTKYLAKILLYNFKIKRVLEVEKKENIGFYLVKIFFLENKLLVFGTTCLPKRKRILVALLWRYFPVA